MDTYWPASDGQSGRIEEQFGRLARAADLPECIPIKSLFLATVSLRASMPTGLRGGLARPGEGFAQRLHGGAVRGR